MKAGGEQIDYGYLLDAHTGGDAYVYFKDSNVLAVGDVASPVKDPELDWITGAWIGARVTAMDLLLKISNEKTQFVPGTGPVMTQAEFKAEREMMEIVRQRLFKQTRAGDGPKDMLEAGRVEGLRAPGRIRISSSMPLQKARGETITSWTRTLSRRAKRSSEAARTEMLEARVKRFILSIVLMAALVATIPAPGSSPGNWPPRFKRENAQRHWR